MAPSTAAPDLDCAAPPNTFDFTPFVSSTSSQGQLGPTVDSWAWASFAALNWPAASSTDTATYPTGYVRGIPDTSTAASFLAATSTDVLVWETFKEKREVFNNVVTTTAPVTATAWQNATYAADQTPDFVPNGQVPPCSPAEKGEGQTLHQTRGHHRVFQTAKLAPALMVGPNALDETAEVASPAQESQEQLCGGYSTADCYPLFPNPATVTSSASVLPPDVINPRNPVGPRVLDPSGAIVYYEVRLNYDYFDYVVSNGLNYLNPPGGGTGSTPASQPPYSLPWRTSARSGPKNSSLNNSKAQYDAATTAAAYSTPPAVPPSVGSIQVKSAWKLLPGNAPDPSYHSTQALHFKTISASPGVCYQVDWFGLIALHIIQRAHMGDRTDANASPYGGTFIFATWEHNSIRDSGGYKYVNYFATDTAAQTPYPTIANALPVESIQTQTTVQGPPPLNTTTAVTSAAWAEMPAQSVWKNYRLIGTQFMAVGSPGDSNTYNQPYYLANLVVETNRGLQNFQGLPRNVTPAPGANWASQFPAANATAYDPTQPNIAFGQKAMNMGGCMGCHGVAQVLGSAFSFVLFDGPRGAGIDTPTSISIPPNPPTTTSAAPPGTTKSTRGR